MEVAESMKIKLQDVVLDAMVEEEVKHSADVTDKPVEKGQDISDHMEQRPFGVRLEGSIVDDAPSKIETLRRYQKDKELLKYMGRNMFADVVLIDLNTRHIPSNAEGFDYIITLQYVKISKPETFEVKVSNPETKEQDAKTATKVKQKTNSGRQQLQSKRSQGVSERSGAGTSKSGVKKPPKVVEQVLAESLQDTLNIGFERAGGRKTPKPVIGQKINIKGREYEVY